MYKPDAEYPENPQLSVAAALELLTSVSLRGADAARCGALLRHLERLQWDAALAEPLRATCAQLFLIWQHVLQSIQTAESEGGETCRAKSCGPLSHTLH
ncbi:MAG: hypothetical protein LBS89_02295 [Zoogloeaceae bacterium]|jgi:hypothetical protein|nr:hypothetical protein [Zoogloeaceae bacterium]